MNGCCILRDKNMSVTKMIESFEQARNYNCSMFCPFWDSSVRCNQQRINRQHKCHASDLFMLRNCSLILLEQIVPVQFYAVSICTKQMTCNMKTVELFSGLSVKVHENEAFGSNDSRWQKTNTQNFPVDLPRGAENIFTLSINRS